MKKEYKNPEIIIIELDQFDVITTSGENGFQGGVVNNNDSLWSGTF